MKPLSTFQRGHQIAEMIDPRLASQHLFPPTFFHTNLTPVSLSFHLLTFRREQMEIVAGSVKLEAAKEMEFL